MIKPKSLYKTEAIVIKSFDLFEADRILTLVSPEYGLIKAVAKGVRKTKSRFGARLEPFSHVSLVLYKGRDLDTITQAELINPFEEIRSSLDAISYGAAMLELTGKIITAGESHKEMFDLILSALETLATMRVECRLLLAVFQLKSAVVAGFAPCLSSCVVCGTGLTPAGVKAFNSSLGGALCGICATGSGNRQISLECARLLPGLVRIKREQVEILRISREQTDELSELTMDYLRFHIDARLKSCEYLAEYECSQSSGKQDRRPTIER